MPKSERVLVGHIGVDAGLCWIGDPCYILHKGKKLPLTLGKSWDKFCELLGNEYPIAKSLDYQNGIAREGLGVVVSTGFGDGFYPVYAEIADEGQYGKRIASVTVVFIAEDTEEGVEF